MEPEHRIEAGELVAIGVGGSVVGHPKYVLDGGRTVDHRLAGAGQFGGDLVDHVHAQQGPVFAAEHQLQQALLAGDETAWGGAELATADLVGDGRRLAVLLAHTRPGDLGHSVDGTDRKLVDVDGEIQVEGPADRLPPLVGGD